MVDIQNINGYGIEDPGFALLREVAQRYCPEEARVARQSVLPDEALNLTALEAGFKQLLGGGSGYADLPYFGDPDDSRGAVKAVPQDNGFGIGIPETQKLRDLHYEEVDTLNSEEIKKDSSEGERPRPRMARQRRHHAEADSGHRQDQRLL